MSYAVQLRKRLAELDGESETEVINLSKPPEWFHDKQQQAYLSPKPIIAVCAGWQSGKTVFLPPWLKKEIQAKGPGDYGAFSSTYKLLSRKFLPELRKEFDGFAVYHKADMQFIFTAEGSRKLWGADWNGLPTVIQLGYAENPDSLESATMKAIVWDEPGQSSVPEQSFRTVESRLMVNRGRMALASRPYEPGWYEQLVTQNREDVEVINFPSWANPMNPKKDDPYWDEKRAELGWRFTILYEGIFRRPAGAIFDLFCDEHVRKETEANPKWPKCAGFDFGGRNTAAVIGRRQLADDQRRTECVIITDEYWPKAQKSTEEHIKGFRKVAGDGNVYAVGGSHQEEGWRSAFTSEGLPIYEPSRSGPGSVEERIQAVYSAFATKRLFINAGCKALIQQVETYTRKIDPDTGNILDEIDDKASFHLVDALGYLVLSLMPYLLEPDRTKQQEPPVVTLAGTAKFIEERSKKYHQRKRY